MTKDTKTALLKSASWHLVHTFILVANVFFFTGKIELVAAVVSIHVLSETIFYYIHERVWQRRRKNS